MKKIATWRAAGAAALISLASLACPALDYDVNDAVLSITPEGKTETTLTHEPGRSEVRITPPVDGAFTVSFSYLDPFAEVRIAIEDNQLGAGSDVSFPLDSAQASLEIDFEDSSYSAQAGEAQGLLNIERLDVDAETVSFHGSYQGTVVTGDGDKAAVSGYIDATYTGAEL